MSLCHIPGNTNQPLDVAVLRTFKCSVSWLATSASTNIGWRRSSLAEWVYKAMQEMSTKPALWIHAWKHLMAASEEERKMNVDRAKRAFTDNNTLFAPTHHGTVPETVAATCLDSMAPEDDHPEIELLHEREIEEAEVDGDEEDIAMEVPAASNRGKTRPKKQPLHWMDPFFWSM